MPEVLIGGLVAGGQEDVEPAQAPHKAAARQPIRLANHIPHNKMKVNPALLVGEQSCCRSPVPIGEFVCCTACVEFRVRPALPMSCYAP